MLGLVLNIIGAVVGILIPLQLKGMIDRHQYDWQYIAIVITLFIIQAVIVSLGTNLLKRCGEEVVYEYRKALFTKLIYLKVPFFETTNTSELASHLINDTTQIRMLISNGVSQLSASVFVVLGTLGLLFYLDWQLSVALLVSIPLIFIVVIPLSAINGKINSTVLARQNALVGDISENIQNIRLVKAYQGEEKVSSYLFQKYNELKKATLKAHKVDAMMEPIVFLVLFAVISAVFSYGAYCVSTSSLSIGTLISFLIYLFQLLTPVSHIGNFVNLLHKTKGAMSYLDALQEREPEYSPSLTLAHDIQLTSPLQLKMANISFSYQDAPFIENLSMTFAENKKVALVGPSGSGKSTIINLIERFYPIQKGDMTLNNVASNTISFSDWRNLVTLVDQNVQLISGTILDNLVFGLNREVTDSEITEVLSKTHLLDKTKSLDEGVHASVGELGSKLSGGEKQRLQIARALLRDSKILLLDESTSNLDSESEAIINQVIKHNQQNKITIIIAHKLATVVDADVIYFIENGQISGFGTHEELKQSHAKYATFVKNQMIS